MKRNIVLFISIISVLAACTKNGMDETKEAQAFTDGSAEITYSSVVLKGHAKIKEELQFKYSVGMEYSKDISFPAEGTKQVYSSKTYDDYSFDVKIEGLESGVTYYFRAYAKKTMPTEVVYGDLKSFTTLTDEQSIKASVSSVTITTALLQAEISCARDVPSTVGFFIGAEESSLKIVNAVPLDPLITEIPSFRIENLFPDRKYYFKVEVQQRERVYSSPITTFTTQDLSSLGEVVDLGLSVKWRSWNIGASSPEGIGNYYAWGETSPKQTYSWDNYKFGEDLTKYNYEDKLFELEKEDDVASSTLGNGWKMPSFNEICELFSNVKNQLGVYKGTTGVLYSKDDKAIFIPIAGYMDGNELKTDGDAIYYVDSKEVHDVIGYYWTRSLVRYNTFNSHMADAFNFSYFPNPEYLINGGECSYGEGDKNRYLGFLVRPVCQ